MSTFLSLLSLAFFMAFAHGCKVTLCQHDHKPGKCCSKGPGSYDIGSLRGSCPGNDEISLVEVKGRCGIELFEKSRYRGTSYTLTGPGRWSFKSGRFRNDAISSFKISRCTVTLCEHSHTRRGKCCSKGVGSYDINTLRGSCPGNDQLSKVEIVGRCKVLLYQHWKYKGRSYTLNGPGVWTYGSRTFPNDHISSFKIINTRRLEVGGDEMNITVNDTN